MVRGVVEGVVLEAEAGEEGEEGEVAVEGGRPRDRVGVGGWGLPGRELC